MKGPLFKDGQAVALLPNCTYEGARVPEHGVVYHVAQNVWKGGKWYVQLVEIGCLHAYTETAFKKSRRSNLTVALLNSVGPECPF